MSENEKTRDKKIIVCPWKMTITKEEHDEIRTLASLERVMLTVTQTFTSFSNCAYRACPFFDSTLDRCTRVDK